MMRYYSEHLTDGRNIFGDKINLSNTTTDADSTRVEIDFRCR